MLRPGRNLLLRRALRHTGSRAGTGSWRSLLVAHDLQQKVRASGTVMRRFMEMHQEKLIMVNRIIAVVVFAVALCGASFNAGAGPQFAVALQGYDAVSFFEGKAPQKGEFINGVHWNGVTWLFASEEHAQRFQENPTKYAPQFDGYCSLAASLGYKAPGDALTGVVVNGKLYLNFNDQAKQQWSKDVPGNIKKGDENWPRLNTF
jgi:YHS domain-containing protein